ncbi:hypothetical protein ECFRIK1997_3149, partial [Escherichia coli FRIK1997]
KSWRQCCDFTIYSTNC